MKKQIKQKVKLLKRITTAKQKLKPPLKNHQVRTIKQLKQKKTKKKAVKKKTKISLYTAFYFY